MVLEGVLVRDVLGDVDAEGSADALAAVDVGLEDLVGADCGRANADRFGDAD